MAENNPTMAIWLGKQYLGQRDKQETENKNETSIVWKEEKTYVADTNFSLEEEEKDKEKKA